MEHTTARFIYANDLNLHYYTAGDPSNPPVVLLHGGGIDSAKIAWRHLFEPLAQTHFVYALDFPGYGRSERPNAPYTTEYLVQTLTAFVDELCLEQFALVGLSMGGATSLGFTLAHPHRVTRLVLVSSYGLQDRAPFHSISRIALQMPELAQRTAWGFTRAFRPILWAGLATIYFNRLALTRAVLDDAEESVRLELFYKWLNHEITPEGCHTNYIEQLPTLTMPTLLIHGQFDPSVPVKWARRASRAIPNGELVVIPFCGHWVNREQVERFNAAVLEFLVLA